MRRLVLILMTVVVLAGAGFGLRHLHLNSRDIQQRQPLGVIANRSQLVIRQP